MEPFANWPALLLSLCAVVLGFVGFRATQAKTLKDDLTGVEQRAQAGLKALEEKAALLVKGAADVESKARHDLANLVARETARLEAQLRQQDRDMARKEEMQAVERRVSENLARVEAKLDRLADGLSKMAAFDGNVRALTEKLSWLSDRIEALEVRPKRSE